MGMWFWICVATVTVIWLLGATPVIEWLLKWSRGGVRWVVLHEGPGESSDLYDIRMTVVPALDYRGRLQWRAQVTDRSEAGTDVVRDLGAHRTRGKARRAAAEHVRKVQNARALFRWVESLNG